MSDLRNALEEMESRIAELRSMVETLLKGGKLMDYADYKHVRSLKVEELEGKVALDAQTIRAREETEARLEDDARKYENRISELARALGVAVADVEMRDTQIQLVAKERDEARELLERERRERERLHIERDAALAEVKWQQERGKP